jgi:nucleoside phosphorylase
VPDHRQSPLRDPGWLRLLRALDPASLPSCGTPMPEDADLWLLEQVYIERDPKRHPARTRYIPDKIWEERVKALEQKGYLIREGLKLKLTVTGRDHVEASLLYGTPPERLPFTVKVGPMASGNAVVKDGVTWDMLIATGVRTIMGLEMEAATIGQTAKLAKLDWAVMKGVMDYADPNKDDRYKPFAARASAEVLFSFLASRFARPRAQAGLVSGLSSDAGAKQDATHTKAVSESIESASNGMLPTRSIKKSSCPGRRGWRRAGLIFRKRQWIGRISIYIARSTAKHLPPSSKRKSKSTSPLYKPQPTFACVNSMTICI